MLSPAPQFAATDRPTRNDQLAICVKRIVRGEGVPPFREHAIQVLNRTLDPGSTCSQLTRIILRDVGLASQILKIANSARYNRSGRPILSVGHAVTLIGWDAVRD